MPTISLEDLTEDHGSLTACAREMGVATTTVQYWRDNGYSAIVKHNKIISIEKDVTVWESESYKK